MTQPPIQMDENYSSCAESEPFALQVLGDSMEPEFIDGAIIIIDPAAPRTDGAYVFAVHREEYIFRQLRFDAAGTPYLTALNDAYPDLPLENGIMDVKGVIIQQSRRRRWRKRYDE